MTTKPSVDLMSLLRRQGACDEALDWAATQPDARAAWDACPRGDWMLWEAARGGVPRQLVVLAACACAREALRHAKGDARKVALRCIQATERWARTGEGIERVRGARDAAYAYAYADADAAYAYAAYAAAAAAAAADAAAGIAVAVAVAADAVAVAYARASAHARCAAIVRRLIPYDVVALYAAGGAT